MKNFCITLEIATWLWNIFKYIVNWKSLYNNGETDRGYRKILFNMIIGKLKLIRKFESSSYVTIEKLIENSGLIFFELTITLAVW